MLLSKRTTLNFHSCSTGRTAPLAELPMNEQMSCTHLREMKRARSPAPQPRSIAIAKCAYAAQVGCFFKSASAAGAAAGSPAFPGL